MGPGVGPSSSAGHIQDLAGGGGSPQRQGQYCPDPAASPVHSHSYAQQVSLSPENKNISKLSGSVPSNVTD